jgi:hypothetical protein
MRRIAAVAITTGALVVGMGAVSTSADASAQAARTWATTSKGSKAKKNRMLAKMRAHGTYTRTDTRVTVRGYVQDYKKDGWASGVIFRAWGDGKWHYSKAFWAELRRNGVSVGPADFGYDYNYGHFWSTSYTKHLSVAEVAIKRTNTNKKKVGPFKKIF